MRYFKHLALFLSAFISLSVVASNQAESVKRISLMSYAADAESQYRFDLKWTSQSHSLFNLIPKAYAYQEGDSCLILGFKSTYKNGMCRLSLAENAKKYQEDCPKGQYACNPKVFGEKDKKPFCIASSLGPELSKYCSHQVFASFLHDKSYENFSDSTKKHIEKISKTKPQDFSFEKVQELVKDKNFNQSFLNLFSNENNLKSAKDFTKNLCNSIYSASQSKSSKLDLANCEAQLAILNSEKLDTKKALTQIIDREEKPAPKEKEENKGQFVKNILIKPTKTCELPKKEDNIQMNLDNLNDVQENLEAKLYLSCANELFYHKDLPKEARGNYFHDLDGKLNFAKQCWKLDNFGEKEIIHTFVSEEGFKVLKHPVFNYKVGDGVEASLPRNIMKFYDGNKAYYLSKYDNIGQYFDSLPESEFSNFITEREISRNPASIKKKYITDYENRLIKSGHDTKIKLTAPEESGVPLTDAKSCIKERLNEYVGIIMSRSHAQALPYTNEIVADVNSSNRSQFKHKYSKKSEEIKNELKTKIFPEDSPCSEVLSSEDFDHAFEKAYGKRIESYDKYRVYFK